MKGAELAAWDAMSASIVQAHSTAMLLAYMTFPERMALDGLKMILQPGVDALMKAEPGWNPTSWRQGRQRPPQPDTGSGKYHQNGNQEEPPG